MRWPWQRKDNPVARTIVHGLGIERVAFPTHDRMQYVRDGFNGNVTAYAAITKKGNAGAGIPWCLYKRPTSKGTRPVKVMTEALATKAWRSGHAWSRKAVQTAEVDNHALLMLLERPNPLLGGAEFHAARISHLNIHGNSYITGAGPGVDAGKPPLELWLMRPDRVAVVPHPIEMVSGYTHEVGGKEQAFKRQAVLHCRLFAADDDFYGMSPLRVAMRNILTVNEAVRWNYALLKNSARPAAAIVAQAGVTREGLNDLREDVDEIYSGAENAGRPLLLEGTMDIKNIGFGPAEMEWLAGMQHGDRRIAVALNMPPEMTGDGEGKTFANYKEARKAWYMEDVLPQADKDRDAFNTWLTPRYGDGLYLDYDRDQIEALQEEQDLLWSRIERSTCLTSNEKRAALGYDGVQDGDQVLVSGGMVPLSSLSAAPQDH